MSVLPIQVFEALLQSAREKKRAFVESIDVAIRLAGIDPRKSDQQVRGAVSLPNGYGKKARVAVFVETELLQDLSESGADLIGDKGLVDEIAAGRSCDFDWVITTPSFVSQLLPIAKILGKRDLMPNKYGGVVKDVRSAIEEFQYRKVKYKADKGGVVHMKIGNIDFSPENLTANLSFILKTLLDSKPESVKSGKKGKGSKKGGAYFGSVFVSSTMGSSFRIENYSAGSN